jgi:hypothetical protein
MKRAREDDSMIFVLLRTNPMMVRNRNAVNATPSKVEDSGVEAAAG